MPTTFFDRYYKKNYLDENDRDYGNTLTDDDVDAMMDPLNDEISKRGIILHAIGHGWSSAPYGFYATGWTRYYGEISDEMRSSLALYNGKRGIEIKKRSLQKIYQYAFYLFYPAHLVILGLIFN